MFETKAAAFKCKDPAMETQDCVIEKIIRLSGAEYDHFASNMLKDYDFIKDNAGHMYHGEAGRRHCLLVMGEGRRDGILVESQGYDYARYTSLLPNAEDFLTVERYPDLADLNKKLVDMVDFIAGQGGAGSPDGRGVVKLKDSKLTYGIDFMANPALIEIVKRMLDKRPEIMGYELEKNNLIVYRVKEPAPDLTDALRQKEQERGAGETPSVMAQIRAARQAPHEPKDETHKPAKRKGGPEL